MITEMPNIILCFQTGDPAAIDLALLYWNRNREGQWSKTVKEIADGISERKHTIANLVRHAAVAYDLNSRCTGCLIPRELTSRAETTYSTWSTYVCTECREAQARAQRLKEEEQARLERERRARIVSAISNEDALFDYQSIGYLEAVVTYVIMLCSDSAVVSGAVGNPYSLGISPSNTLLNTLLGHLFNIGVLTFRNDTPFDAVNPTSEDETRFSYYPLKVNWQFAKAANGDSFSTTFKQIGAIIDERVEHPEYYEAVIQLWWMLGSADALRYLEDQLSLYRLSGLVVGEKLKEAISYGLKLFSIPQLRYLLYRVAKNAAALSTRHDFNKPHALNTIPGSLIRDCDRATADHWTIKGYAKKWDEESPLLTLLFDRVLGSGIAGFRSTSGSVLEQIRSKLQDTEQGSSGLMIN
jgi:hypothetical protein